jgi:hypothetical protein
VEEVEKGKEKTQIKRAVIGEQVPGKVFVFTFPFTLSHTTMYIATMVD